MRTRALVLLISLFGSAMAWSQETPAAPALAAGAQSPGALFEAGNRAYETGDFAAALALYEQLLAQGLGSAELFYNLANTHYKLGTLGQARLWYERSLLTKPGDDDARHNVNLIRAKI